MKSEWEIRDKLTELKREAKDRRARVRYQWNSKIKLLEWILGEEVKNI